MGLLKNMDDRAKRLGLLDIKLIAGAMIFLGFIIAKLVPQILNISFGLCIGIFVLLLIKPYYTFLKK